MNWPNDPGVFSDLITDGAEKPSFRRKEARPFQDMIDDVNHDSFFGSSQFHDLYQSSRRGFAGLHGPSANSREASAPLRSVCDSCKSRFAAVSAFHSSVIVR